MIPSKEEYEKAKSLVNIYEKEQQRLLEIKVGSFRKDLDNYFADLKSKNLEYIKEYVIKKDSFNNYRISFINPYYDECYDGEFDKEISRLSDKHGVYIQVGWWQYGK